MLVERKTSFAGFTPVMSLARSKVAIAAVSEKRATSKPFSGSGLVFIVEEQGEDEKTVECALPRMRLTAAGKQENERLRCNPER